PGRAYELLPERANRPVRLQFVRRVPPGPGGFLRCASLSTATCQKVSPIRTQPARVAPQTRRTVALHFANEPEIPRQTFHEPLDARPCARRLPQRALVALLPAPAAILTVQPPKPVSERVPG